MTTQEIINLLKERISISEEYSYENETVLISINEAKAILDLIGDNIDIPLPHANLFISTEIPNNDTNLFIIGIDVNIPYIIFPNENKITYFQDFCDWKSIPADRKFFPIEYNKINDNIKFIANNFGIIINNKWNFKGKFGNGAIYVSKNQLPKDTFEWCKEHVLEKS